MEQVRISIMQPYLFPNLNYFRLMTGTKFIFLDDVNFMKRGFVNRNSFWSIEEGSRRFSVPIHKASQNKKISELKYLGDFSEIRKNFEIVHKSDRFYHTVEMLLDSFLQGVQKTDLTVSEVNIVSLRLIADFLGIKVAFMNSSELPLKNDLKGQSRILEICKILYADVYLNASGGRKLYNSRYFSDHSVQLCFQAEKDLVKEPYEFCSILSVISKFGQDRTKEMLEELI